VNIAEDVGHSFPGENDILRFPCLIETEIESLAVEQGKDVVKEGIGVGKRDDAPHRNNQEVR
jgi:hypothetical protein